MAKGNRFGLRLLFLIFLMATAGCVYTPQTKVSPPLVIDFKGETRFDHTLVDRPPQTVAVLPFLNRTDKKEAFDIVRKSFHGHLSKLNYTVIPLFRVDDALRQAGLDSPEKVYEVPPQKLREILRVDALVKGAVTHYDRVYVGVYSQAAVGAEASMVDGRTGKELWWAKDVSRKHAGGVSTTPIGLIFVAVSTALNMREIELLRSSDDLFRKMVQTIPQPTIAQASRPPNITLLVHDGMRRSDKYANKVGDEIKVAMEGDPRMRAFFHIGDLKKDIPMKEEEPGVYTGSYRVLPGDNVQEALIVATLLTDVGISTAWADVMGLVTIDTNPPDIPKGLKAAARGDRIMEVRWAPNTDKDIARYKVYRSNTPLTGYQEIGTTEWNTFQDKGLKAEGQYYYKVSALDLTGNESNLSDAAETILINPGPTPVKGAILGSSVWYAAASPYVIEGEITIAKNATLRIEPGTVIRSKGDRILVQGKLVAQGGQGRLILFEPFHPGQQWAGIHFQDTPDKENVIEYAKVNGATVGISCVSSSPSVANNEISHNQVGIQVRESFAKPLIQGNRISSNAQVGVEVLAMAAPRLEGNEIQANQKHGVLIRESQPMLIRNHIFRNAQNGIFLYSSPARLIQNSIHDNGQYGVFNSTEKETVVDARDNWWGTLEARKIIQQISGRVDYRMILDGPPPDGKSLSLPILPGPLNAPIEKDAFLLLMHSPYVVEKEIIIGKGATLFIEPGVTLKFNPGAFLRVRDGGIDARGTPNRVITFTSNSASPSPGSYPLAIKFEAPTFQASFFHYAIFEFAETGLDIGHGAPDIHSCFIGFHSQAGLRVFNEAEPKISFSTFLKNMGTGAVVIQGMARPKMNRNNFMGNAFAIQSFSRIYIDARENWWGSDPPAEGSFLGEINYKPWLGAPEGKAFQGGKP